MFLQVMPCLKEGCIGPRRAFPGVSTHLTYFPGGCRQVVPLATGKSPLLCMDFQGNATFSRKTSKEKADALVAGGLPKAGLCPPLCLPPSGLGRQGSAPASLPHLAPGQRRRPAPCLPPPRLRLRFAVGQVNSSSRSSMNNEWGCEWKPLESRVLWVKPSWSQPAGALPPPQALARCLSQLLGAGGSSRAWPPRTRHPMTLKLLIYLLIHLIPRAQLVFAIMATIPTVFFLPPGSGVFQ